VQGIDDPLSRLIAVAVLFQAGKASPPMIDAAIETASAQGWRRPLLAWLKVQAMRAEKAGDAAETQRLQRRIALVEQQR
jgi:primosomal protein N''